MAMGIPTEHPTTPVYSMFTTTSSSSSSSFYTNTTDLNNVSLLSTSPPSPWYGPLEQYTLFWVLLTINRYYLWVILAIGLPGNVASFVTILRMPPLTTSTGYIAALAVVDTLAIVVKLLFHQLTLHDVPIGAGGCQTLYLFGSFFATFANWILVAISAERFIAIWFPQRFRTLVTKKTAIGGMGALALSIFLLLLHFLWTATVTTDIDGGVDCGFKEEYIEFIQYTWYWIGGCLYAVFPCVLLAVFNSIIIADMRRSRRFQRDLTKKISHTSEKFRQEKQINLMLIVVSVVFIALVLPNSIFFLVSPFWTYTPFTYGHIVRASVKQIVCVLSDMNHAANFYLYILTAPSFRRKFVDLVRYRRNRMKYAISTTANNTNTAQTGMDVT